MRTIAKRLAIALGVGLAVAAAAPYALAEPNDTSARALFEDGRRLMRAGQYDAACPKLEAARAIYAGPGVLLNLGDCYEKTGRIAAAWATFDEAITHAAAEGRAEYEAEARRRQDALTSRVARLAFRAAHDAPDVVVRCDGKTIDRRVWPEGVPVDPGPHLVQVEAPGHSSWSASMSTVPGTTTTVDIPELPVLPSAALAGPPAPALPAERLVSHVPASTSPRPPAVLAGADRTGPSQLPNPPPSEAASRSAGWIALASAGGLVVVGVGGLLAREWEAEIYDDSVQCEPVGSLTRRDRCGAHRDLGFVAEGTAIAAFTSATIAAGIAGILLLPRSRAWTRTSAPKLACHTAGIGLACGGTF